MRGRFLALAGLVLAVLSTTAAAAAGEPMWREVDPANALLIETSKGPIFVEMRPELAPNAVERVKTLARTGIYDGLLFHRVIDGFVDQTGNPNNKDGGVSALADLAPEFDARLPDADVVPAARRSGAVLGFLGALPVTVAGNPGVDGRRRVWGLYCAGVAGMGRQADPGTANSEIFFMRAPARRLDHDYTVFGRAVVGLKVVKAIAVGVPPANPDRMSSVKVLADIPSSARPRIVVLNERSAAFAERVTAARRLRGADFSPCDLDIPAKIIAAQAGRAAPTPHDRRP